MRLTWKLITFLTLLLSDVVIPQARAQTADPSFAMGNFVATQLGFNSELTMTDGLITNLLNHIAATTPIPPQYKPGGDCSSWGDVATQGTPVLSLGLSSRSIQITQNGLLIRGMLTVQISNLYAYARICHTVVFCICSTLCNDYVTASAVESLSIAITANGVAPVNITGQVEISSGTIDISGCASQGFLITMIEKMFGITKGSVQQALQSALQHSLDGLSHAYSVPTTYNLFNGVTLTYQLAQYAFVANNRIDLNVSGIVAGEHSQYVDPSACDASLLPPTQWQQQVGSTYLLAGLRVSSTLLNAAIAEANENGDFVIRTSVDVLDTVLDTVTTVSAPVLTIVGENLINMTIASGIIRATCECTTCVNATAQVILELHFVNLVGVGFVAYTNDVQPGVYVNITHFDLSSLNVTLIAPSVPLPVDTINQITNQIINKGRPNLNQALLYNALRVPASVAPYLPNPEVVTLVQPNSCELYHGYIQISSHCSSQADPRWPPCSFSSSNDQPPTAVARAIRRTPAHGHTNAAFDLDALDMAVDEWVAFSVDTRRDRELSETSHEWSSSVPSTPERPITASTTTTTTTTTATTTDSSLLNQLPVYNRRRAGDNTLNTSSTVEFLFFQTSNPPACSLSSSGSLATALYLPTTTGTCVSLPTATSSPLYYAIASDTDGNLDVRLSNVRLLCRFANCTECIFSMAQLNNRECVTSTVSASLSLLYRPLDETCMGAAAPLSTEMNSDDLVLFVANHTTGCDHPTATGPPALTAAGTTTIVPLRGPADGVCRQSDPKAYAGWWQVGLIPVMVANHSHTELVVRLFCSQGCSTCQFSQSYAPNTSLSTTCFPGNHPDEFFSFKIAALVPACGVYAPNHHIGLIIGCLVLVVLFIVGVWLVMRRPSIRQRLSRNCLKSAQRMRHPCGRLLFFCSSYPSHASCWGTSPRKGPSQIFKSMPSCTSLLPTRRLRPLLLLEHHNVVALVSGLVGVGIVMCAWLWSQPFRAFSLLSLQALGFNITIVNVTEEQRFFDIWILFGGATFTISFIVLLGLTIGYFFYTSSGLSAVWHRAQVGVLASILVGFFLVLFLFPLVDPLSPLMTIRPNPNSFFTGNPVVRGQLDELLSISVVGVMVSFESFLLLFFTMGLVFGVSVGCMCVLIVITQLLSGINNTVNDGDASQIFSQVIHDDALSRGRSSSHRQVFLHTTDNAALSPNEITNELSYDARDEQAVGSIGGGQAGSEVNSRATSADSDVVLIDSMDESDSDDDGDDIVTNNSNNSNSLGESDQDSSRCSESDSERFLRAETCLRIWCRTVIRHLSNIRSLGCVILLVGLLSCALPLVVNYQAFSLPSWWLGLWFTLWVLSIIAFFCLFKYVSDVRRHVFEMYSILAKRHRTRREGDLVTDVTALLPTYQGHDARAKKLYALLLLYTLSMLGCFVGLLFGFSVYSRFPAAFPWAIVLCIFFLMVSLTYFVFVPRPSNSTAEEEVHDVLLADAQGSTDTVATDQAQRSRIRITTLHKPKIGLSLRQRLGARLTCIRAFLREDYELSRPSECGLRLPYRRTFLGLSNVCYLCLLCIQFHALTTVSVQQAVQEMSENLGLSLTWPPGETVFTPAFVTLRDAEWISLGLFFAAYLLQTVALLLVCVGRAHHSARNLFLSRLLICASLGLMFGGLLAPGMPNYLRASNLATLMPSCGPQFDMFMVTVLGDVIGLTSATVAAENFIVILLAIVPALERTARMMLLSRDAERALLRLLGQRATTSDTADLTETTGSNTSGCSDTDAMRSQLVTPLLPGAACDVDRQSIYSQPLQVSFLSSAIGCGSAGIVDNRALACPQEDDVPDTRIFDSGGYGSGDNHSHIMALIESQSSVRTVFECAPLLSPLLTVIPLMVTFQLFGDWLVALFIAIFWLVPIFLGLSLTPTTNLTRLYYQWLAAYFLPLAAIVVYVAVHHHFTHYVVSVLASPSTYIELVTEITLANVIVSDLLYATL